MICILLVRRLFFCAVTSRTWILLTCSLTSSQMLWTKNKSDVISEASNDRKTKLVFRVCVFVLLLTLSLLFLLCSRSSAVCRLYVRSPPIGVWIIWTVWWRQVKWDCSTGTRTAGSVRDVGHWVKGPPSVRSESNIFTLFVDSFANLQTPHNP